MNIFKFELKRNFKSLIYWIIGTSAIIILFMALFPSMESMGMQELVGSKLDALPPAILEMFNISSASDFSNINDYLGYCLQYVAMAFGVYGAILGINSIIEEESEGTIEFLYSKPVSRRKILWSKILSVIVCIFIYIFAVGLATIIMSLSVKSEEIEMFTLIANIKMVFAGMAFLSYIFMATGVLISTLLKKGKGATSIGIGLFFGTYILGIVSKLKEDFSFIKYFSPSEWVIPSNIIKNGFEGRFIVIGFIIITITLIAANIIYDRKDLKS